MLPHCKLLSVLPQGPRDVTHSAVEHHGPKVCSSGNYS